MAAICAQWWLPSASFRYCAIRAEADRLDVPAAANLKKGLHNRAENSDGPGLIVAAS